MLLCPLFGGLVVNLLVKALLWVSCGLCTYEAGAQLVHKFLQMAQLYADHCNQVSAW